jgi:uncharacterized repeat protein (TIGR02543 family)
MYHKWFSIISLVAAGVLLLSFSSCARNQHLTSIQVVPPGATFEGVGAQIQFKAFGTYSHPPATKDITDKVQWSIDSQNLANITSPGLVTAISICGSGNLIASFHDSPNDLFGTAFLTGGGVGTTACNQALLTVSVLGSGTVTSSPAGINCPGGACSAVFPLDSSVGLTATPSSGHNFVGWTGCNSTSNTCNVLLTTNVTVTATFN